MFCRVSRTKFWIYIYRYIEMVEGASVDVKHHVYLLTYLRAT